MVECSSVACAVAAEVCFRRAIGVLGHLDVGDCVGDAAVAKGIICSYMYRDTHQFTSGSGRFAASGFRFLFYHELRAPCKQDRGVGRLFAGATA